MTAPRILMPLLFAACMRIVTGIRSSSHWPRRQITFKLARQLWQPVAAMAESYCFWPRAVWLSGWILAVSVRNG